LDPYYVSGVRPYILTHFVALHTFSFIHSFIHSLTHSLTHSVNKITAEEVLTTVSRKKKQDWMRDEIFDLTEKRRETERI